jgi:hypothetical protein
VTEHCGGASLLPNKRNTTDSLRASAVGAPATFKGSAVENGRRNADDVEVPFARLITDITGTSPQKRRTGNMPRGYSR